jgi:hypothetical protein
MSASVPESLRSSQDPSPRLAGCVPERVRRLLTFPLLFAVLFLAGCSDSSVGPESEDDDATDGAPVVTDSVDVDLPVDDGEVGIVVDTREIFRKGYVPSEAEVAFPEYPSFDATLEVDPVTNLAVLSIPNEDLTEAEAEAFADGVAATIRVYDDARSVLADRRETSLVLDDSNAPLTLESDRAPVVQPINLRAGIPYLLRPEAEDGLVTTRNGVNYPVEAFAPGDPKQQFYFTPVEGSAAPNTYTVQHFIESTNETYWSVNSFPRRIDLRVDLQTPPPDSPHEFVLEPDEDGWVRIRVAETNEYLSFFGQCTSAISVALPCELRVGPDRADRFRIISDGIDWRVTDQGTVFNEPITPPAQLDFAYAATIRNCSPATLTETVGRSESRTRSSTTTTTESLQLFSSVEVGVGYKVGVTVGAGTPGVGHVEGSVEYSTELTVSTSSTRTEENTISETTEETEEVSRTRELEVPPFSAIEVYDAVRTIENVRIPFTQVFRIRGTARDDGAALSGSEIRTQLRFNLVEGVPSAVGADFVDVSVRGDVFVDQMFETETNANELAGVCD